MALISFVIPVLNEEEGIAARLIDLALRYPKAQRVVVDGGSRDHTVAQAMPHCEVLLTSEPGRAVQMNLGANVSSGHYLFFLHADTRLTITWQELESVLAPAPQWGFCRVRLAGEQLSYRVIEAAMNIRSICTRVATGDQMVFVRNDCFEQLGGFAPIPLMEDVELSKRLRRAAPPTVIATPVITSSRRWEEDGLVSTVIRMWLLRLAYFIGVSPRTLWAHYYGS